MKRSFAAGVIIGAMVAFAIAALHASGLLANPEMILSERLSHYRTASHVIGNNVQYALIVLLSLGTAILTGITTRRGRMAWIAFVFVIELAALSWVCSLYHTFFQPLPGMAAIALAFVGTQSWMAFATRSTSHLAATYFAGHLSRRQIRRMTGGEIPVDIDPHTQDVTVVVCDIANKYDLAEESDPAEYARTTEEFIRRTTDLFLDADAYIDSADGEGIVALFGFPDGSADHASKAVRITLGLVESFRQARQSNNGDFFGRCDVHMGVSSGSIIVAPIQEGNRPSLLTSGEPVELARRFCVANRFYGSRILIGPRTFELASKFIVARPIDFLSGVNSQERHEIYEPLWLAADAQPEHIARRDSFWNGVVLYREKRWAEAYTEFQKARGPDGEDDAPLNLYLRRLETLALHLTTAPD